MACNPYKFTFEFNFSLYDKKNETIAMKNPVAINPKDINPVL